jgi:hypothetical protein
MMAALWLAWAVAVGADARSTIVMEFDEGFVRVQESWDLVVRDGDATEGIRWSLPERAERVEVTTEGWTLGPNGREVRPEGAVSTGGQMVVVQYRIPRSGHTLAVSWPAPSLPVEGIRLAYPDLPGVTPSTSRPGQPQTRDASGVAYRIWDIAGPFEGGPFRVSFEGLPNRPGWPRWAALALALLLVPLAVLIERRLPRSRPTGDPARVQRVLEALRQLEAQLPDRPPAEVRHRRRELLDELSRAMGGGA